MSDNMRERFEEYIVDHYGDTDCLLRSGDGYINDEIDGWWCAWQASRSVPVKLPAPFRTAGNTPYLDRDEVVYAIETAGYRVE